MKGKASNICPKCKYCEGLDMFTKMYSCKHYNNYPDAAIGVDCEIECDNFEAEGINQMCPKCKYCLGITPQGMYSCGKMVDDSTLNVGTDVIMSCASFEEGKVENIASYLCPKCKHCEGSVDIVEKSYYVCGDSHSDGGLYHLMGAEDELYCTAYEEETNMNKLEGKASEFCPKCKNGKVVVWDGVSNIECEDPYDGLVREMFDNDDIRCSMFEIRTEKKEKESCDKISLLQHELEMDKLRRKIYELEKEKSNHLKGIERLKKSQEKLQNQVKNLQTTNEESYKREEKLEEKLNRAEKLLSEELGKSDSWKRDYEFVRDKLIYPICNILYPDKLDLDINVTDFINDVKNLKVEAEENETMYNDLKYWKERCHKAETDITTLNSKVETLKKKNDKYLKKIIDQQARDYKQCSRIMDLEFAVNKLQSGEYDDALVKDIEIKSLQAKYEDAMNGWNHTMESHDRLKDEISKLQNIVTEKDVEIKRLKKEIVNIGFGKAAVKDIIKKNNKLNQTISDQEITIKALLITIKEMCKEDETNE